MLGASYGGYSYPGGIGSFSEVFTFEETSDIAIGLSAAEPPRLSSVDSSLTGVSSRDTQSPRLAGHSYKLGTVISAPSPKLSSDSGALPTQLEISQAPAYTESQYIDADAIGVDADAAVDAGHNPSVIQSGAIRGQMPDRGIDGRKSPAPAVSSGEQKPSGKIVISIPR